MTPSIYHQRCLGFKLNKTPCRNYTTTNQEYCRHHVGQRYNDVINTIIQKHRVVIFSKSYCSFSRKAKAFFHHHRKRDVFVMELDQLETGYDTQSLLTRHTGQTTVPYIYIDGSFIGGYDKLLQSQ